MSKITIPNQILEHIFTYIDNYQDIINFKQCDRYLYNITLTNLTIQKHIDQVYQKCFLDLREEIEKIFDDAHEFASRMEELYNEPMEYITTYCETIDGFVGDLLENSKSISNKNNRIKGIIIPPIFKDWSNSNSCSTFHNCWNEYLEFFPHAKIIVQ